jgi:hypothetical protein
MMSGSVRLNLWPVMRSGTGMSRLAWAPVGIAPQRDSVKLDPHNPHDGQHDEGPAEWFNPMRRTDMTTVARTTITIALAIFRRKMCVAIVCSLSG